MEKFEETSINQKLGRNKFEIVKKLNNLSTPNPTQTSSQYPKQGNPKPTHSPAQHNLSTKNQEIKEPPAFSTRSSTKSRETRPQTGQGKEQEQKQEREKRLEQERRQEQKQEQKQKPEQEQE